MVAGLPQLQKFTREQGLTREGAPQVLSDVVWKYPVISAVNCHSSGWSHQLCSQMQCFSVFLVCISSMARA